MSWAALQIYNSNRTAATQTKDSELSTFQNKGKCSKIPHNSTPTPKKEIM